MSGEIFIVHARAYVVKLRLVWNCGLMDRKWCVLFLEQTSLIASETNEPLSPGDQMHTHYRLHTSKLHTHLSFTNTDVPPTPHQSHTYKYQQKKHFKQCSWRHIQFLIHKHAFCCTFVNQISQATHSALFHCSVLTCKREFVYIGKQKTLVGPADVK